MSNEIGQIIAECEAIANNQKSTKDALRKTCKVLIALVKMTTDIEVVKGELSRKAISYADILDDGLNVPRQKMASLLRGLALRVQP